MSNIDTQGNYNNTPDSWDQEEEGGAGDQEAGEVGDATKALSGLNVNAAPFIPGQNPFAKEFVPSFLQNSSSADGQTAPAENSQSQSAVAVEKMEVDQNGAGATNEAEENTPDDWADNSPENGSSADDAGGGEDEMDEEDYDEEDDENTDEAVAKPKPKRKPRLPSTSSVKKDHVNIVFIGHVDAGKSTIGGHIMYLTGMVDKRTLEKYEREAKEKNRESWYLSWALDTNTEERDKGKTVEVGRAYFETENKHFTILDAPGHKSFVPNMIGGASQADVAVLVISARRGEFETGFERGGQTREHAMLVKTAGVKHLIVVVNKMDDPTVEWDETRYTEIKDKLTPYLKKCGFNPKQDVFYIPVSGLTGAFLKEPKLDVCPWYSGPPLIQYLDDLPSMNRMAEGPVRLPIVDRYKDMGTIVLGKVESGSFKKGSSLIMMPNKVQVEVMQLWSDDEETDLAKSGENVKVKLKNVEEEDVSPGFVLCSLDNLCHTGKVFDAQIVILEHKSIICAGYSAVIHIHTCAEEVTIKALICLVDKKTGEKSRVRPRFVKQDQIAIVRFEISGGMICLEAFKDFPQMGRFTLRDEGRTIAIGKVLKVIE
jgi:peptide chain release factor subunit 3